MAKGEDSSGKDNAIFFVVVAQTSLGNKVLLDVWIAFQSKEFSSF